MDMKVKGRLSQVANLLDSERNQMFALMDTYYENMDRAVFDTDLEEKQWVILLEDPMNGIIRGFSTQTLLEIEVDERPIRVLFSGDTIVDRQHWSHNPLAQVWGQFVLSLIDADHSVPLYWFLMTKGYRTYRFLPVFFHEFYPRDDSPTPAWAAQLIDTLGQHRYPSTYDPVAGVVHADPSSCRLRPNVAEITTKRLRDRHVQFFVQANPRHAHGDELCCIAPLTRDNFALAAYRVIGSASALMEVTS